MTLRLHSCKLRALPNQTGAESRLHLLPPSWSQLEGKAQKGWPLGAHYPGESQNLSILFIKKIMKRYCRVYILYHYSVCTCAPMKRRYKPRTLNLGAFECSGITTLGITELYDRTRRFFWNYLCPQLLYHTILTRTCSCTKPYTKPMYTVCEDNIFFN